MELINLGELSKPATVLIEKISDAIGGIFRPYQIKRIAQAEGEAEKIKAIANIEVTEIQERAAQRFFIEEAKRQKNIESITTLALPLLEKDGKPENLEEDWISNFFERCRLISDEEMQSLWAKVLAGEANSPGKYSKRTVNLISSLDKKDAQLFTKLCGFCVELGAWTPLIYDTNHSIYNGSGINFSALAHLEAIGLINHSDLTGYVRSGFKKSGVVPYFQEGIFIEFPKEPYQMKIGKVLLTQSGQELAPLSGAKPIDGFPDYLRTKWKELGYATEPSVNVVT